MNRIPSDHAGRELLAAEARRGLEKQSVSPPNGRAILDPINKADRFLQRLALDPVPDVTPAPRRTSG